MIDNLKLDCVQVNLYLKKYKRYFDLFLTPFILLLFSPILILTFLLLRVSSTEKVIYKQLRIGLNGNLFPCYKFRTMHNTNTVNEHITSIDSTTIKRGILNKQKDDKRITKIGSFLRQTSLDELPQLFNVLRGEMSLVGPRPLMPFMLKPYPEIMIARCNVMPGLTGLWQVKGRKKNTSVMDMIDFDLEYIKKANLIFDLSILFLTIFAVLRRQGAY